MQLEGRRPAGGFEGAAGGVCVFRGRSGAGAAGGSLTTHVGGKNPRRHRPRAGDVCVSSLAGRGEELAAEAPAPRRLPRRSQSRRWVVSRRWADGVGRTPRSPRRSAGPSSAPRRQASVCHPAAATFFPWSSVKADSRCLASSDSAVPSVPRLCFCLCAVNRTACDAMQVRSETTHKRNSQPHRIKRFLKPASPPIGRHQKMAPNGAPNVRPSLAGIKTANSKHHHCAEAPRRGSPGPGGGPGVSPTPARRWGRSEEVHRPKNEAVPGGGWAPPRGGARFERGVEGNGGWVKSLLFLFFFSLTSSLSFVLCSLPQLNVPVCCY